MLILKYKNIINFILIFLIYSLLILISPFITGLVLVGFIIIILFLILISPFYIIKYYNNL